MKAFCACVTIALLICVSHLSPLRSQDLKKVHVHFTGGVSRGNFDDLNYDEGLSIGDQLGNELEPDPFRYGYRGEAGITYDLFDNQRVLVQGAYERFGAYNKARFTSSAGEELGIKELPVYHIRNVPLSVSYLFHAGRGRLDFFGGPGIGYQWARFVEKWPDYGTGLVEESEFVYSGSAPVFKVMAGGVWRFSRHVSLSLPVSYRHANVKEMKLTSSRGSTPENGYLVDPEGGKIPIDLSGFSIGLGLIIR